MNSRYLSLLFLLFSISVFAQDTVRVQSLTYATSIRDTIVKFPDGSDSYEKILMKYSMRCKGARISTGSNRNLGCGEWDYSCNTYIVDSSRIDSLSTNRSEYSISSFSGDEFNYTTSPVYDLYRKNLISTAVTSSSNITNATIGQGSLTTLAAVPVPGNAENSMSGTSIFLYTASELIAAGLSAGEIDAISLFSSSNLAISKVQLDMKTTTEDSLTVESNILEGWENVFLNNQIFSVGKNQMQFHKPFTWDGTSNILIKCTRDQNTQGQQLSLQASASDTTRGLVAYGGRSFYLNGSTYLESNNYDGVLGNANRTMSAWIKTTTVNGEIISYGRNATGQKWVFRVNGNGKLRVEINGGYIVGTKDINDGEWHHVACVLNGNAVSDITLFVDGDKQVNTELSSIAVNTTSDIKVRVSLGINNRQFTGNVDNIKIWDRALTEDEIKSDVSVFTDSNDPSLQLYYSFNTVTAASSNIVDLSGNGRDASTYGDLNTTAFRGFENFKDFTPLSNRPNISFISGDFDITNSTTTTYDSVLQLPNRVRQYSVVSNSNTIFDDDLEVILDELYWNADGQIIITDAFGNQVGTNEINAEGTIQVGSLTYQRRWPSRIEIMSFVTPYGINLDLGPDGKSWWFDLTDFTPILTGDKRMFLSRGGQNQEEMDIEFLFIKGTPSRNVISLDQIWPTQQYQPNYTQIQANTTIFPEIEVPVAENVKGLKIRSAITGHGQDGEFIPRNHTISAGDTTFTWSVWKECANNPVYPQGGTWIYDRAGWCPGMATDVAEYDVLDRVQDGTLTVDYNVTAGSGDSRYIVNNQLVSYGDYNFNTDISIEDIIEPSNKAAYARDNPMCINPKMLIKNTGKDLIYSVTVDYWVNDKSNKRTFKWACHLNSEGIETVYFPIDDGIWSTATTENNYFHAEIVGVNGSIDEYLPNNKFKSAFDLPEFYAPDLILFYRTNSAASENSITIKDQWDKIAFERTNLQSNTLYRDTVKLGLGCKTLEIKDSDGDGMSFFANNDGSGFFRINRVGGGIEHIANPDFGNFYKLNFTVLHPVNVPEKNLSLGYKLYPNPTRGNITISGGDFLNTECEILNSLGQQVSFNIENSGDKMNLTLIDSAPGFYVIKLTQNGYVWTKKIIVEQ